MEYDQIIQGNAIEIIKTIPRGKINCVVTSPPYWGLRDYKIKPQIWDGEKGCEHEWGKDNFCIECGAWKGSLGSEPTFELYIEHLCDIFDRIKEGLREDGTCWINLGDTYVKRNPFA